MTQISPETSQVLFRHEYEHELDQWLRRRFSYLCTTYVVVIAAGLVIDSLSAQPMSAAKNAVALLVVAFFAYRRDRHETRDDVVHAVSWMILALGTTSLAFRFVSQALGRDAVGSIVGEIFFWHFTACLFLPWTPRDSLRPIVPLMAVWAVGMLLFASGGFWSRLAAVVFSPGILMPGLLISAWRLRSHSRQFRSTMLGRHVKTLRQEFTRARTIHESLFPETYNDGYVRFEYTYTPMRELGGDFLHLHVGPEGLLHLALLDVTGHGLAAALTVNRIYGEMERIRAESPHLRPGEVLTLLNRYLRLTMVRHNIYATAVVLMLDPYLAEVHWASAGHPPAFLRAAGGEVRSLDSTTLVLGAIDDDEFRAGEERLALSPGDVIVAYTDGAFEARNRTGESLGLDAVRRLLEHAPPDSSWPDHVAAAVERHQYGRAEDDVLIAALSFTAARGPDAGRATAAASP